MRDIGAVINMVDSLAGPTIYSESGDPVGLDFISSGISSQHKMDRHISAVTLDSLSSPFSRNDSFEWLSGQASDMESTATSRIKKPRIEVIHVDIDIFRLALTSSSNRIRNTHFI